MKAISIFFVLVVSLSNSLWAHDIQRLRTLVYEPGARDAGMGGALIAWAQGTEALYYNPAGVVNVKKAYLSAGLNNGIVFSDYFSLSWARSVGTKRSVGIIYSRSSNGGGIHYDPIEKKSIDSKYYDFALGFSFAQKISSAFAAGINAKYIRSVWGSATVISEADNGFAFDFGLLMTRSIGNADLRSGLVLKNIGPTLGTNKRKLPSSVNLGLGVKKSFFKTSYVLGEVDIIENYQGYVQGFDMRSGIELGFSEFIFLRGGFISKRTTYRYFVYGLGVSWGKVYLDLAFAPIQPKLEPETSLFWKISIAFGQ